MARVVANENAVGNDRVEMKVQVEAAAEALDVVDGRVLALLDVGFTPLLKGDRFDEDATERASDVGAKRGQSAKLERQREHPLAHGDGGEDTVDEVRGNVRHAAPGAARTNAT